MVLLDTRDSDEFYAHMEQTAFYFNDKTSIVFEDQGNRSSDFEAIGLAVARLRDLLAS